MAYKHKITTSIPFDSDTPNLALDSVIDFITNKFIADTPALSVTKEIAYDAEAYKGFPVFSEVNESNFGKPLVPVSKIVFLGKHTDSLGLLLFCTQNDIYYDLHICIMPSFDMMCVTPATYGEDYQSSASACTYIYRMLRGWPNSHIETRLVWNVTPGDSGMINMSIVSAGSADYGYAYIINSGNTSYTQFHIGFVRQGESALSMWWKNNNAGLFDIDYQYPLKAGVFSPKMYDVVTGAVTLSAGHILADTTGMDYLNDDVAHKIILIGNGYRSDNIPCGLHQFFLGNNKTLTSSYISNLGCMQPTLENLAGDNKAKSYELWSGESLPHLTGEQIFLRQLMQPLSLVAFTSVYRLALASLTTPRAGTVYTTDTGTYITLLDNCVTYALKLK